MSQPAGTGTLLTCAKLNHSETYPNLIVLAATAGHSVSLVEQHHRTTIPHFIAEALKSEGNVFERIVAVSTYPSRKTSSMSPFPDGFGLRVGAKIRS